MPGLSRGSAGNFREKFAMSREKPGEPRQQNGEPTGPERVVPGADDPIFEALLDEQRRRWHEGEPIGAVDYIARQPILQADPQKAATLVYQEFVLREQRGDLVSFTDYLRDFSRYADDLRLLHDADQFVTRLFADSPVPAAVGRFLGEYELEGEIGRGGMGIVYRARQRGLQRRVALKTLSAGGLASSVDIERFCNEARAVGQLQHPNIVAIHTAGIDDGQHFFTMDLVEGKSLAELVGHGPLSPERAARYVRAVAEAVHYAHEQGILHRDLKPSNILIDGSDQPRITDFGLAHWLAGDSRLTVTGQVLGTPGYMSPEQASARCGRLSAASDVYALGAILYELVTGRPTLLADTPLEALLLMVQMEPVAPRLLNPRVPRDLETICLKCLEKEPGRRYASAAELAADLERFLDGVPVRARPIGRMGRLWRWCRRQPRMAGLLAAVACLVSAIVVILSIGIVVIRNKQLHTEQARTQADANLELARELVDDYSLRLCDDERLRTADFRELRKELLTKVVPFYEKLSQRRGQDRRIDQEWAKAEARLALICNEIGERPKAVAHYQLAIAIVEPLAKNHKDERAYWRELAKYRTSLGDVFERIGELGAAETEYQRAKEIRDQVLAMDPSCLEDRFELALILAELASVHRGERAEREFPEVIRLLEQLNNERPKHFAYQRHLARTYFSLGHVLFCDLERPIAAEKPYLKARSMQRELVEIKDSTTQDCERELASTLNELGLLYMSRQPAELAIEAFKESIKLKESIAQRHPTLVDNQRNLANTLGNLGITLQNANRLDKAEAAFRRGSTIHEGIYRRHADDPLYCKFTAGSHCDLGNVLRDRGDVRAALQEFRRALEVLEFVMRVEPDSQDTKNHVRNAHMGLGTTYAALTNYPEAIREFDLALRLDSGDKAPRIRKWKAQCLAALFATTFH